MGATTTIELPWPPKELSPNARVHWSKKAKVSRVYRDAAYWLAKQAGFSRTIVVGTHIPVRIAFYPPDRRHRDDDNAVASFKAARDGIAEAIGIDDRLFRASYTFEGPVKGGKVVVTL